MFSFLLFYPCDLQDFFNNKDFVLPVYFVSFSFNILTKDISSTFSSHVLPRDVIEAMWTFNL